METVRIEGKPQVARQNEDYSLDVNISVGYGVNFRRAAQFRDILHTELLARGEATDFFLIFAPLDAIPDFP